MIDFEDLRNQKSNKIDGHKSSDRLTPQNINNQGFDIFSNNDEDLSLYNMYKAFNLTDEESMNKFFLNLKRNTLNKDNYIREFDEYYFRAKPKFSPKLIKNFL